MKNSDIRNFFRDNHETLDHLRRSIPSVNEVCEDFEAMLQTLEGLEVSATSAETNKTEHQKRHSQTLETLLALQEELAGILEKTRGHNTHK